MFEGQKYFHMLSPATNFTWVPQDIKVIDPTVDVATIGYGWPKIVQISAFEFLLVGGNVLNEQRTSQHGVTDCLKLNTKTCRLTKIASLPTGKMASQVIYIPPETGYIRQTRNKSNFKLPSGFTSGEKNEFIFAKRQEITQDRLGYVYCMAGRAVNDQLCKKTYVYNIAADTWTEKADCPRGLISFNMVPFSNKYILLVANGSEYDYGRRDYEEYHDVYDYKEDKWIKVYNDIENS